MFATPAFAQTTQGGGAGDLLSFVPLLAIFAIMYFMVMRPQQQRAKRLREKIAGIRRGDTVVTNGGLIGKVVRVTDDEIQLDVGENVRVRAVRSMVADVRSKSEPATVDTDDKGSGTGKTTRKGRAAKSETAEKAPATEDPDLP
jgi:preprotein translocase subunit YajC